jgi:hypothetical protein
MELVDDIMRQININKFLVQHAGKTRAIHSPPGCTSSLIGDTQVLFGLIFKLLIGKTEGCQQCPAHVVHGECPGCHSQKEENTQD